MLRHYYLHQMKLLIDFDPKKSNLVDMLIMQYAVTFKLQKTISLTVKRKEKILALIGILSNVSDGCLEEYSTSPILLYP